MQYLKKKKAINRRELFQAKWFLLTISQIL